MIDPVSRAAAQPAFAARPQGQAPEPKATPQAAPAGPASGSASPPDPLSLDVAKAEDGVFVYTLSDPGTGLVLAVIPRQDVQSGRDGRNLDRHV